MKIEKLSTDKIKVTVSTDDFINLDIDVNDLSPNSEELHSFLFHIMETIRARTGFNPYTGQVVVEATPMREGMTIVVSKIKSDEKKRKITKRDITRGVTVKARLKKDRRSTVFFFDSFDDMSASLCLLDREEVEASELYKYNGGYAIITSFPTDRQKGLNVLREFSGRVASSKVMSVFTREHGTFVAKGNALWEMTENIRNLT